MPTALEQLTYALMRSAPSEALDRDGFLKWELPEVHALFGVAQRADHHPEICSGIHTLMAVDMAAQLTTALDPQRAFRIRLAVLLHDVGKALTPKELLPRHHGHEVAGIAPAHQACVRLGLDPDTTDFVLKVTEFHLDAHRAHEMRPGSIVKLLQKLRAADEPERVVDFATACEADKRGRLGKTGKPYPEAQILQTAAAAFRTAEPDPRPQVALNNQITAVAAAIRPLRTQR